MNSFLQNQSNGTLIRTLTMTYIQKIYFNNESENDKKTCFSIKDIS